MSIFDQFSEHLIRRTATHSSRRGIIAKMGKILVGAAVLTPVLPIDRISRYANAASASGKDDPGSCDYWKYCAVDGFLCSCCGGSSHECPPGTEPGNISWIGTCHNDKDGRNYLVSYNDCCGKTPCGHCQCNTNKGDRPGYAMGSHNDINWCMGNSNSTVYNCTVSIIVGVADD